MAALSVFAPDGLPEIVPGDDLVALLTALWRATAATGDWSLAAGDILVVTSKIVSKAEGRVVAAADREDAITAETVREVARRAHPGGVTRIVQNRQGLIMAAAGVDASNTPPGTVLLLPEDPDASARRLAGALSAEFGVPLGVIISDTSGRAWREGQIDLAIGAAGITVLEDHRGERDTFGQELEVTLIAVADELAGAAELVKGKAAGRPVAVIRGRGDLVTGDAGAARPSARDLVRAAEKDMFGMGRAEAEELGYRRGLTEPREG